MTYEQKVIPKLIKWYHAAAGFPATSTWLRAINDGFYQSWPGLTVQRVKRYLGKSEESTYGHLHLIRQGIRSTTKHLNRQDIRYTTKPPRSRIHKVEFNTIAASDLKNMIGSDLAGRYPLTSTRGNKYILIMYDHDANYTYATPIKSREAAEIKRGFKEAYMHLVKNGFNAKIVRLDNEISKILIKYIEEEAGIKYQLVSPGDHRDNPAERAIRTFKAHFIAMLSGTDPDYPPKAWDLLLPQAVTTLNFLNRSRIQPKLSAYSIIHGNFDFNATPLAPAGCKTEKGTDVRGTNAAHQVFI